MTAPGASALKAPFHAGLPLSSVVQSLPSIIAVMAAAAPPFEAVIAAAVFGGVVALSPPPAPPSPRFQRRRAPPSHREETSTDRPPSAFVGRFLRGRSILHFFNGPCQLDDADGQRLKKRSFTLRLEKIHERTAKKNEWRTIAGQPRGFHVSFTLSFTL
uniref:Uncharacterized protein n=1 Tax=Steinernema glaseri TaxID=37863 RepID=A0A1I7ZDH8_9BILA